ncbi:helix-turn-helix domain-containing protein [Belliella sp. DSM 111904]|uniref:Helix-turn-helix domain-containing protein n=1 Tax=Belliella filtrata TaxID=2923435 RepID=A0ABS9V2H7_9BACT|nr:helix-turn-helix domain-containing protein [Belliella filtrata]MCH7410183.1 helix-turn-helix domain-containing protein [Belliella filtrata]
MKQNSKRKGIWIPLEILGNNNLDPTNKILLAEILSLTELPEGCFASNQYFAELLGLTKSSVSKRISSLQILGYINTDNIYKNNQCLGRIITKGHVVSQKTTTSSTKKKGSSLKDREVVPQRIGGSSSLDRGVVLEEIGGISEGKPINTTTNSNKINTNINRITNTTNNTENELNIECNSNNLKNANTIANIKINENDNSQKDAFASEQETDKMSLYQYYIKTREYDKARELL